MEGESSFEGGWPGKTVSPPSTLKPEGGYRNFRISELFIVKSPVRKFNANEISFGGKYPYVARGASNNGIRGKVDLDPNYLNEGNTLSFGQDTATIYYQPEPYFTGDKIKIMKLKQDELDKRTASYLISCIRKAFQLFSWGSNSFSEEVINSTEITLPIDKNYNPDFQFMRSQIRKLEEASVRALEIFLSEAGFENYDKLGGGTI